MNKIKQIYELLLKEYGKQGWWPHYKNGSFVYYKNIEHKKINSFQKFIICISAILTQNTNWDNVEKAIKNLISNNLLSKEAIKKIDIKKLAKIIKSSGYHNQKAKKLKEFVKFLDLKKEINRENLLSIWGIGKETADSILLYAYNQPIFVIDAYTKRIINRSGFKEQTYDELQNLFMNNLDKDVNLFKEYHALLVKHGKDICKKKPLCKMCCLKDKCNLFKSLS